MSVLVLMLLAGQAVDYAVTVVPGSVVGSVRGGERHVDFTFRINRASDGAVVTDVRADEVAVTEERRPVQDLQVFPPRDHALTVVLAIDVSGSMSRANKLDEAKKAALTFLDRLDPRAEAGLILFDHEVVKEIAPSARREPIRAAIQAARPKGGTAYLDAAARAAAMLRGAAGRRAAIVLTDGVDTNSTATLEDATRAAQAADVPVFTVGIGTPGKNEPVSTVLVLDRSESMLNEADGADGGTKFAALKKAAKRFVDLMRPGARTTLLPFSDEIRLLGPLTDDRGWLRGRIGGLRAEGTTLLFDATLAGVETLVAADAPGRRAVVVLTDGRNEGNGSQFTSPEVIARARAVNIPLHMLGLGKPDDVDEPTMRRMADQTGGSYHHADSERKLVEAFEGLSIRLHDDGIDEPSLRRLAEDTGGRYTHASDLSQLAVVYERLADELQQTYRVRFQSRRSRDDGTARDIDVAIRRGGRTVSTVGRADDVARGLAVPQMSYGVYLMFLVGLLALLSVPGGVRRLYRAFGGT